MEFYTIQTFVEMPLSEAYISENKRVIYALPLIIEYNEA